MWGYLGPVLQDCWETVGVFYTCFKKATLAAVSRIVEKQEECRKTNIPSAGTLRRRKNTCSMNECHFMGAFYFLFELIVFRFLPRLIYFLNHIFFCPWRSGRD